MSIIIRLHYINYNFKTVLELKMNTLNIVILVLFKISLIYCSLENANYENNCLGCLKNGNNFCMIVPSTFPGKCCSAMASNTDYCDSVYKWCTYPYVSTS